MYIHEADFVTVGPSGPAWTPDPLEQVPDGLKRATARLFSDAAALERAVHTAAEVHRAGVSSGDAQRARAWRERSRAHEVLRDRWLSDCVRLAEQVSEADLPRDARMVLMTVLGSINERVATQPIEA